MLWILPNFIAFLFNLVIWLATDSVISLICAFLCGASFLFLLRLRWRG